MVVRASSTVKVIDIRVRGARRREQGKKYLFMRE